MGEQASDIRRMAAYQQDFCHSMKRGFQRGQREDKHFRYALMMYLVHLVYTSPQKPKLRASCAPTSDRPLLKLLLLLPLTKRRPPPRSQIKLKYLVYVALFLSPFCLHGFIISSEQAGSIMTSTTANPKNRTLIAVIGDEVSHFLRCESHRVCD